MAHADRVSVSKPDSANSPVKTSNAGGVGSAVRSAAFRSGVCRLRVFRRFRAARGSSAGLLYSGYNSHVGYCTVFRTVEVLHPMNAEEFKTKAVNVLRGRTKQLE